MSELALDHHKVCADQAASHGLRNQEPVGRRLHDAVRVESAEDLLSEVTAFTHPRRQVLVRCLTERPLDAVTLAARSKISMPAVFRHLRKLRRRGLVGRTSEDTYILLRPESRFAQRLLQIAVE